MSANSWQETLVVAQADGAALTASTTATSLLPTPAQLTLPANFFNFIGKTIRIRAAGRVSNIVTTPGTLTLDHRLGTVATPIVVFNGGALALNIIAQTNATWELETILTARTLGSGTAATLMGTSHWTSRSSLNNPVVGTTNGVGVVLMPDTAPAVGTGFDSTITNVLDFFAKWSLNNANSIQVHQYIVESLN